MGCGIGRTLAHAGGNGVGVDHNADSVAFARIQGLTAYEVDEFWRSPHAVPEAFDALLFSHVLEHLAPDAAAALVARYAPLLRAGGRAILICPQEAGFRSDPTHVAFQGFDAMRRLAGGVGLSVEKSYSFPFPRFVGRVFPHNEFVLIARKPGEPR